MVSGRLPSGGLDLHILACATEGRGPLGAFVPDHRIDPVSVSDRAAESIDSRYGLPTKGYLFVVSVDRSFAGLRVRGRKAFGASSVFDGACSRCVDCTTYAAITT